MLEGVTLVRSNCGFFAFFVKTATFSEPFYINQLSPKRLFLEIYPSFNLWHANYT